MSHEIASVGLLDLQLPKHWFELTVGASLEHFKQIGLEQKERIAVPLRHVEHRALPLIKVLDPHPQAVRPSSTHCIAHFM